MSETLELQKEEIEALISIYEGDNFFKQLNDTTFQYKYGEDESEALSFNVEIIFTEEYPNELPKINLDTYYNRNISSAFKSKVVEILQQEGETWLGCGMTYTLFECLKEKMPEFQLELEEEQKNVKVASVADSISTIQLEPSAAKTQTAAAAAKKEQMTKAQKRKMWSRTDNKGNRQRGWDWVDIIKHLSQTGGKDDAVATSSSSNISTVQPVIS